MRIVKSQRKVLPLRRAVEAGLADSVAGRYTDFETTEALSMHLQALKRGNITTGPERTPLGVMTSEQCGAYKRQRLEKVLQRPNPTTLAAITAAKADEGTDTSFDDL